MSIAVLSLYCNIFLNRKSFARECFRLNNERVNTKFLGLSQAGVNHATANDDPIYMYELVSEYTLCLGIARLAG